MNLFTRKRYIRGSLRRVKHKRVPDTWEHRYPDRSQAGSPLRTVTYSTADYPTKAAMWRHIDTLLWKLNSNTPQNVSQELSFGGVSDRYIKDEHLREISGLKRGQANTWWAKSLDSKGLLADHRKPSTTAVGRHGYDQTHPRSGT